MYLANVSFQARAHSSFSMNHEFLINYSEESTVVFEVKELSSITIFFKLAVDPITKALLINGQSYVISAADHKAISVKVTEGKGMFIHRVRDFTNIIKEYAVKNINYLLKDFTLPI